MNLRVKVFGWVLYAGLGLIFLYTISPFLLMGLGMIFAKYTHCTFNEAGIQPCVVLGIDWGSLLTLSTMSGFLIFFVVPSGMVAGGVFFGVMLLVAKLMKLPMNSILG